MTDIQDFDDFVQGYDRENAAALELLTEALSTHDEAEISAAWELYEQTSTELEAAQNLAKEEWGWEEKPISDEETWVSELEDGGSKPGFFENDPSLIPGSEPRGEPFMFEQDAVNYVADIAGFAQGYFGIFENEVGGFEVWYSPEA